MKGGVCKMEPLSQEITRDHPGMVQISGNGGPVEMRQSEPKKSGGPVEMPKKKTGKPENKDASNASKVPLRSQVNDEDTDVNGNGDEVQNATTEAVPKTKTADKGKEIPKTETADKGKAIPKTETADKGKEIPKTETADKGKEIPETETAGRYISARAAEIYAIAKVFEDEIARRKGKAPEVKREFAGAGEKKKTDVKDIPVQENKAEVKREFAGAGEKKKTDVKDIPVQAKKAEVKREFAGAGEKKKTDVKDIPVQAKKAEVKREFAGAGEKKKTDVNDIPVQENKAEAKKAFKALLSSVNVDLSWKWGQAKRAIIKDERYKALKTLSERKAAFTEYLDQMKLKDEEKLGKQKKISKTPMVILEHEPHIPEKAENNVAENSNSLEGCKIFFPSRDDEECIEICYNDIQCLDPGVWLTSTIMCFFIRYLQKQLYPTTSPASGGYHFFNTFFYTRLEQYVSDKQSGRKTDFGKFRRWWKGVNIFRKAYIFLPIHKGLHWSLIIICMPHDSVPIIHHLDSLRSHHRSETIFDNVRSCLTEEWNYLRQEGAPSDDLIAAQTKQESFTELKIVTKITNVPQQGNAHDCGIFVLYFMMLFIMKAPNRARKKDLEKFGENWFKAEDAPSLRGKIKKLLKELFREHEPSTSKAAQQTNVL